MLEIPGAGLLLKMELSLCVWRVRVCQNATGAKLLSEQLRSSPRYRL